jgi:hypothetical protein
MAKRQSTCVVCCRPFDGKQKAGEITIRFGALGGSSMVLSGPVCPGCVEKSSSSPDVALDQMRQARAFLLADNIGAGS